MMPATTHDRQNLAELIAAHEGHLRQLLLRRARQGDDTAPHVVTEIERVESELAQLKQAAATPISATLVEELGPAGRYQLWMAHIMRLDADIGRLRHDVERMETKIDDLIAEVLRALGRRSRRKPL
jgi:uncharacterized protein YicC (UPF0701 family)